MTTDSHGIEAGSTSHSLPACGLQAPEIMPRTTLKSLEQQEVTSDGHLDLLSCRQLLSLSLPPVHTSQTLPQYLVLENSTLIGLHRKPT